MARLKVPTYDPLDVNLGMLPYSVKPISFNDALKVAEGIRAQELTNDLGAAKVKEAQDEQTQTDAAREIISSKRAESGSMPGLGDLADIYAQVGDINKATALQQANDTSIRGKMSMIDTVKSIPDPDQAAKFLDSLGLPSDIRSTLDPRELGAETKAGRRGEILRIYPDGTVKVERGAEAKTGKADKPMIVFDSEGHRKTIPNTDEAYNAAVGAGYYGKGGKPKDDGWNPFGSKASDTNPELQPKSNNGEGEKRTKIVNGQAVTFVKRNGKWESQ